MLGATVYTRAEYWDSKADEFGVDGASGWTNGSLNDIYHRKEISLLEETFPVVKGLDVLDAGCGTGRLTRHFAQRGARVTGIDFSQRAIEFARGKGLARQWFGKRIKRVDQLSGGKRFGFSRGVGVRRCGDVWGFDGGVWGSGNFGAGGGEFVSGIEAGREVADGGAVSLGAVGVVVEGFARGGFGGGAWEWV